MFVPGVLHWLVICSGWCSALFNLCQRHVLVLPINVTRNSQSQRLYLSYQLLVQLTAAIEEISCLSLQVAARRQYDVSRMFSSQYKTTWLLHIFGLWVETVRVVGSPRITLLHCSSYLAEISHLLCFISILIATHTVSQLSIHWSIICIHQVLISIAFRFNSILLINRAISGNTITKLEVHFWEI